MSGLAGLARSRSMFHVKHPRRVFLVAVAALALLGSGCGARIAQPEGWSAPAADGDQLLVQLERGTISAGTLSSAGTFSEAWRYPTDTDEVDFDGFYATPVVDDGTVYIASYDGKIVALDANTGQPVWPSVVELKASVVATPVLQGGRLYLATGKGEVVELDPANGNETGRLLARDGRIWSTPVVQSGVMYVGELDARQLSAVQISTGEILWKQDIDGAIAADLALVGDLVIVGSLDRAVRAFDTSGQGREPLWEYDADGWVMATPLVAGDTVYGATLRGEVFALNATSGTESWIYREEGLEFRARPVLMDGILVVADRDGRVRGLDPSTGELRWERNVNAELFADALVYGGELLYVTKDGGLLRVAASDGTTTAASAVGG
jgi:outer membrane protein assembly factor BamB